MHNTTIYDICKKVDNDIKSDFGGGCPIEKSFLMSYLVENQKLKTHVEIGIYRGKSFFPVAYSIYCNGGKSYGIDPYEYEDAKESDVPDGLLNKVDDFLRQTNFNKMYQDVVMYREKCGYGDDIKIIRKPSQDTIQYFKENNIKIDFLHIDGNHDTKFVRQDFELYNDILVEGGFIVFDDINWESVNVVYREAKKKLSVVFECEYYGILYKNPSGFEDFVKIEKLQKRLTAIYNKIKNKAVQTNDNSLPLITIGVLTYNHEAYVAECLKSITDQKGNFRCQIIILDDASTDNTESVIKNFLQNTAKSERLQIDYIRNENNLGMVGNYSKLVRLIQGSGCDYFAFCEGDDFYFTNNRLETHLNLHLHHPELALSFNKLLLYFQETNTYELHMPDFNEKKLSAECLAQENRPGSNCASFYDADVLNYLNDDFFTQIFPADWIFCLFCSQFGDIGHINTPMSVYRKHSKGVWSGNNGIQNNQILYSNIPKYNKYLNFLYDPNFQIVYDQTAKYLIDNNALKPYDIAIIDNIFPHPLSGFSYQEFTNILEKNNNSIVCATGSFSSCLSKDPIENLIIAYKQKHPELSDRVFRLENNLPIHAKLLYGIFLTTAYHNLLPLSNSLSTPFVFTLYPGGGFLLNDSKSDEMLQAVFTSPWFRKVIVTQQITYDYLIKKKFCKKEDIEYIFGVVTDVKENNPEKSHKQHFGIDKDTLDICFVAHKYSEKGKDKGYDLFIETAKQLSKKYSNIAFHIVGPWDENIIDTSDIKNLTFYGLQSPGWFTEFYQDKDIIISPNLNGTIVKGNFDGFPTTSVTDASLHEVAMFCTDPLSLNQGRFKDGEEIVILKHSSEDIVKKVEHYYHHPEELESLVQAGKAKSEHIYSYKNQIEPRLRLLNEMIKTTDKESYMQAGSNNTSHSLHGWRPVISKVTPNLVKRACRKSIRIAKKIKEI